MPQGIAASRGIGIGSVCRIIEHELKFENKKIEDTAAEKNRLQEAVEKFKAETTEMAEDIRQRIGKKEAEILEGHLVMISDPAMVGEMDKMIDNKQCAEAAVTAVCDMFINMFSSMDDEMSKHFDNFMEKFSSDYIII